MQGMAYWTGHNRWLSPVGPVQQTNLILLSKQKIDEAVHDRNRVQKERGKPYTGRKRNEKTKQNKTKRSRCKRWGLAPEEKTEQTHTKVPMNPEPYKEVREQWMSGTRRVSCWCPIQAKCCSHTKRFTREERSRATPTESEHVENKTDAQSADTQSDDAASSTLTRISSNRVKRAPESERLEDYIVENM